MKTVKRRADDVFQDFMLLTHHNQYLCRAIREALHRTQAYFASHVHIHQTAISQFEHGEIMSKDTKKAIYDYIHKLNYEEYSNNHTDDYILYCLRVMGNYMSITHEWGYNDDDELCKKLMSKLISMLCFVE